MTRDGDFSEFGFDRQKAFVEAEFNHMIFNWTLEGISLAAIGLALSEVSGEVDKALEEE